MTVTQDYSIAELMGAVVARQIRNDDVAFIGVGIPLIAGIVAVGTHAPGAVLVYEGGGIGARTRRIPWTISDNPTTDNAMAAVQMWRVFGDQQRGLITLGIIGGAQIDRFGNINSTVIFGEGGTYATPKVRLPGSGGANDIASSALRTVIMMRLEKGKFVRRVDFITSPGYLGGPGDRERAGLSGGGPVRVVTDRCTFAFDEETREMYLETLYPGVTADDVRALVAWDLAVSPAVREVEPPEADQLRVMRAYDPMGFVLGKKSAGMAESFEDFCVNVRRGYESLRR